MQTGTTTVDIGLAKSYAMMEAAELVRFPQFIFYEARADKSVNLLFEAWMPEASDGDKLMGCGEHGPYPPCEGGGPESMEKALVDIGVRIDDIQTLVVNYLYVDHGWKIDVFPGGPINRSTGRNNCSDRSNTAS